MATELQTETAPEQGLTVEEQVAHLRELFEDAPEVGKKAFENVFKALTSQASQEAPPPECRRIDDFATKIPDYLDIIDSAWEGWPGIRSPHAKDYLAEHQVTAEGWYVANPDLTAVETRRLKRNGQAGDEFLDKIGDE